MIGDIVCLQNKVIMKNDVLQWSQKIIQYSVFFLDPIPRVPRYLPMYLFEGMVCFKEIRSGLRSFYVLRICLIQITLGSF